MALNSLANLQQDFNQLRSNYSLNAYNRQGSRSAQRFRRDEMTRSAYIGGGIEPPTVTPLSVAPATVAPTTVEAPSPSVPASTMGMGVNSNSNTIGARPFGESATGYKGEFPSLEAAVEDQFTKGLIGMGKNKAFDVAMTGKQLADAGLSLSEVAKLSPQIAGAIIANPKTFGGVMTKALDVASQATPARDLARGVRTEMTRMGNPAADVEQAANNVAYQQFADEMAFGGAKKHLLTKMGVIDPQLSTQLAAQYIAPADLAGLVDIDPNAVSGYFGGTVPSAADVEAGQLAEAVSNAPSAEEAQAYNLGLAGFRNAQPTGMSMAALGGETPEEALGVAVPSAALNVASAALGGTGGNAVGGLASDVAGDIAGVGGLTQADVNDVVNSFGNENQTQNSYVNSYGGWSTPTSGYGSPGYGGGAGRQGGYGGTSGGWA